MDLVNYFGIKTMVIGMIHLLPLPGTPFYESGNYERSMEKAITDARALFEGGADGCVIQTMDRVYNNGDYVDYARLVCLTNIVQEVSNLPFSDFLVGVQILFNANIASLAVSKFCGGDFIRSATYIGATHNSTGTAEADANGFQEYRKKIDAGNINVVAEIQGMHYKNINKKSIVELANEAILFGADIVEVADQDEKINQDLVTQIKNDNDHIPVYLGGYTNHENVVQRMQNCDGVFVGSCFESQGWGGFVDKEAVKRYVKLLN